jgi:hypothetical protein
LPPGPTVPVYHDPGFAVPQTQEAGGKRRHTLSPIVEDVHFRARANCPDIGQALHADINHDLARLAIDLAPYAGDNARIGFVWL